MENKTKERGISQYMVDNDEDDDGDSFDDENDDFGGDKSMMAEKDP